MKKRCMKCGGKLGFRDGVICPQCFESLGLPGVGGEFREYSNNYEAMKKHFENVPVDFFDEAVQRINRGEVFVPWYAVGDIAQFDDRRKEARLAKSASSGLMGSAGYYTVPYERIWDYRIIEDNVCVRQGGFSGAVLGGSLTDSWEGAFLGEMTGSYVQDYCRSMQLVVILKGSGSPRLPMSFIVSKTNRDSALYRKCCIFLLTQSPLCH